MAVMKLPRPAYRKQEIIVRKLVLSYHKKERNKIKKEDLGSLVRSTIEEGDLVMEQRS
mgnify:CR=1 FL=1